MGFKQLPLAAVHRDHGPGAEVNAVAIPQRDQVAYWYLTPVEVRTVGGARIEHSPAAVRGGDKDRVQPADAWIGGRVGQVDLWPEATCRAAPTDPHLLP